MKKLGWKKIGSAYLLECDGENLVTLEFNLSGKSSFTIANRQYDIRQKGFWNPRYEVHDSSGIVANLSHNFWGSKGKISFADGSSFNSDYIYENTLTLRFMEGDHEILRYWMTSIENKQMAALSIGVTMVDGEKLLLMATLGMTLFLTIFNEFSGDGGDATMMVISATL